MFYAFFKLDHDANDWFTDKNKVFDDVKDGIEYTKNFCKFPYKSVFVAAHVTSPYVIDVPVYDRDGNITEYTALEDSFNEVMSFESIHDAIHVASKFEHALIK